MDRPVRQIAASPFQERPVNLSLRTVQAPGTAVVRANQRCTAGPKASAFVRHIELELQDADLLGAFAAGQCVGVIPPGVDARQRPLPPRLFSLASPTAGEDGHGRVISLTVKRLLVEDHDTHTLRVGVASNYLCDLTPGAIVRLVGPVGKRLVLPANAWAFNYVLLATGTGIAPMRGIVLDLLTAGVTRPIHLYAGAAYATDLLYDRQFTDLDRRHANFHYQPTISRHAQSDGSPAMYVHQRMLLDRDTIGPVLADSNTLVYACGIAGMERGIHQALTRLLPPDAMADYLQSRDGTALKPASDGTLQATHHHPRPGPRMRIEVY